MKGNDKMKKRIFSLFAVVALTILASVSSVSAHTDGFWEYDLLDNQITLTNYTGSENTVNVPSEILGIPVTKITGEKMFPRSKYIVFPGTIQSIGNCCTGLTNLKTVSLCEGCLYIEDDAFNGCKSLTEVKIPSSVKKIGNRAFKGCMALTEVNIPSGLEYGWDESAFENSGITSIDFSNITNLKSGTLSMTNCKSLVSAQLYPKTTALPEKMFAGCGALKSISIPSGITMIPKEAFNNCLSLENVILPTTLKSIELNAFNNCDKLIEVVVPYGTEKINASFKSCNNLESLYIPDTVHTLVHDFIDGSTKALVYCSDGSPTSVLCKRWGVSYLTDSSVNSGITVIYNGKRISFQKYEQNPEIINDNTLVPLRAIFEAMNAGVSWNGDTQTVTSTRGQTTISLAINDPIMIKNGEKIRLEVPAQLFNERTMVPVRVIAEAFGADVKWDGNGRTVIINENI